ncbi:MAG: hypothetical protein MRJ65_15950 [Candidatus Brocadiaceae bacterium]|nr:hypothetical protein [Candidatus Brocadiaceae bacterium]
MSLMEIIKEREQKKEVWRKGAIAEVKRLARMLKKHFTYESMYVCGSLLTDRSKQTSDIDIIVKGLKTKDFFKEYALLMKESVYPIDMKPFEYLTGDFREKVFTGGMKIG